MTIIATEISAFSTLVKLKHKISPATVLKE